MIPSPVDRFRRGILHLARLGCAVAAASCAVASGCAPLPATASLLAGPSRERPLLERPLLERPLQGRALLQQTTAAGEAVLEGPMLEAPSHDRLWRLEQAVLPYSVFSGDGVSIRNVRQCRWRSEEDRDVRHADWRIAWRDVRGVDFIAVPFRQMPLLAHTMLSFRLADGRCLVVSVEARLERGETYSAVAGAARQYELMYVLGDEPDLLGLRGEVRRDDIYLYETRADGPQAARLLRDILERVQQLAAAPEFYDSVTNNCTTNLVYHLNRTQIAPMPADWRNQMPGQSDRLAHALGLLKTPLPFELAKQQAWISYRVRQHLGDPDFSQRIRQLPARAATDATGHL